MQNLVQLLNLCFLNFKAVVVEYSYGSNSAQIIVDGDANKNSISMELGYLHPCPEILFSPATFKLDSKVMQSLLNLLESPTLVYLFSLCNLPLKSLPHPVSSVLRLYAARALTVSLRDRNLQGEFLNMCQADNRHILFLQSIAQKCKPSDQIQDIESASAFIGERAFELTPPLFSGDIDRFSCRNIQLLIASEEHYQLCCRSVVFQIPLMR